MLSREDNELLTRTGPGTPMGDLMRRYWLPALVSHELPTPDCAQMRLRILGEDLIAFRATDGRVGIVDEVCPHRRASLYFARNEDHGLRCAYHGWKFNVDGDCVEIPSEPDYDQWTTKPRIKAYPAIDHGGVVWVYMGPPDRKPAPPELEWTLTPDPHRYVARRLQECNWLQGIEGGIDPVHVPFLHRDGIPGARPKDGNGSGPLNVFGPEQDYTLDTAWHYESEESEGGIHVVVRRNTGDGANYWRISEMILPCFSHAPPYGDDPFLPSNAWVPRDDTSLWRWNFASHPMRPLTADERGAMASGQGVFAEVDPETLRPLANIDNDYFMDREGQQRGDTFGGIPGVAQQDQSIQES
ncbi:MAG: Rieske 2Fe-2S domain-containing protein [Pseudomonadota bacterium]|nr:Rieske 2Fe-2S domain-containing protein [Pseudomonadota bacterium]